MLKVLDNTPMSSGFDYTKLAEACGNIHPWVAVEEIKRVSARVTVIEEMKYKYFE